MASDKRIHVGWVMNLTPRRMVRSSLLANFSAQRRDLQHAPACSTDPCNTFRVNATNYERKEVMVNERRFSARTSCPRCNRRKLATRNFSIYSMTVIAWLLPERTRIRRYRSR